MSTDNQTKMCHVFKIAEILVFENVLLLSVCEAKKV